MDVGDCNLFYLVGHVDYFKWLQCINLNNIKQNESGLAEGKGGGMNKGKKEIGKKG
jgi:hypothetical protein